MLALRAFPFPLPAFAFPVPDQMADRRGGASARGYNARWQKARRTYLMRNPLCVMCAKAGATRVATVVDHIKPHKGDTALFWDSQNNWQPLCKPHHDRDKQRFERGSTQKIDADGWPT